MSEKWFNTSANNNASVIDEWNLMLAAGSNAVSIMKQHYDTWLTEADVDTMQKAGINALRIPIGRRAGNELVSGFLTQRNRRILGLYKYDPA